MQYKGDFISFEVKVLEVIVENAIVSKDEICPKDRLADLGIDYCPKE